MAQGEEAVESLKEKGSVEVLEAGINPASVV